MGSRSLSGNENWDSGITLELVTPVALWTTYIAGCGTQCALLVEGDE
jgi:hypothetical protein